MAYAISSESSPKEPEMTHETTAMRNCTARLKTTNLSIAVRYAVLGRAAHAAHTRGATTA
tara:strand:- start:1252 stop:1431 length:180 start_codon:yes stop_codon:yes gene_type:complete